MRPAPVEAGRSIKNAVANKAIGYPKEKAVKIMDMMTELAAKFPFED
jgi:hypothetical protein